MLIELVMALKMENLISCVVRKRYKVESYVSASRLQYWRHDVISQYFRETIYSWRLNWYFILKINIE